MSAKAAPISETFVSVQGEGALTGVPSWFVRFSGCNLRCRWCDTPYASWSPEGDRRSIDELTDEASRSGVRHAVVTGGEPLIFPQAVGLCQGLRDAGLHVTIETAGTVAPSEPESLACDLMSISPKLANSTPTGDPRDPVGAWAQRHESRRLNFDALAILLTLAPARQLKFVVTKPTDLAEIEGIVDRLRVEPSEVMLMPEGVAVPDPESIRWVVEACLVRQWRYCPRLQIELFGDTRGT